MELLETSTKSLGHLLQGEDLFSPLQGAAFLHFVVFSHFYEVCHADRVTSVVVVTVVTMGSFAHISFRLL